MGRNVNTIDIIYPSMPIFLYTNPVILSTLLEPTLRYMESNLYGQLFVPHDLGEPFIILDFEVFSDY